MEGFLHSVVNMSIFKTYDIRGVWGEELDENSCTNLAKAIGTFCINREIPIVVLARDGRNSSPEMYEIFKQTLLSQGINIYDVGLVPTPVFYYSVIRMNVRFGIMITASHNPKEYNGVKMCYDKALPLTYNMGISEIERIYQESAFESRDNEGNIQEVDGIAFYCEHLCNFFKAVPLNFAVDVSNGPQSLVIKKLKTEQGITPLILNSKVDGNFPGHSPNPMKEGVMGELSRIVQDQELNFGVCFDGDGDRIAVVDEKGRKVALDSLFSLFIKYELIEKPGETVYYDLRFSKIVEETILKYRGVPKKMRVGNPFYKEKLLKQGGVLAGELSGHIMFAKNYSIDDPVYAMLRLLEILKKEKKPLSQLLDEFGPFYKSEEINLRVEEPDKVLDKIEETFSNMKIEKIDGISVYGKDFWFNVRKSNTEPLVRLNIEADNPNILEREKEEVREIIINLSQET